MEQSLLWQLCSLCSSPANAQKAVTPQRGEQENQSPVRPREEARRGQERLVRSPARLLQAWHQGSSTTAFSGVAASCHRSEEAAFCLGGQRRRQGGWEARAGQRRKGPGAHGQHPLLAPRTPPPEVAEQGRRAAPLLHAQDQPKHLQGAGKGWKTTTRALLGEGSVSAALCPAQQAGGTLGCHQPGGLQSQREQRQIPRDTSTAQHGQRPVFTLGRLITAG